MESVLFGSAAVYALGEGQAVCTTMALLVAVMAWLGGHMAWLREGAHGFGGGLNSFRFHFCAA